MKRCTSGVEAARIAFLYGEGDGKPVVSTQRLAVLAGVREKAIRSHMGAWLKEKEEIASKGSKESLALFLSSEKLKQHEQDTKVLREQTNFLAKKLELLPKCNKMLLDFIENFDEDREHALRIYENFIRGVGAHANILKSYQSVRSDWAKAAGVDAYSDVQVAGAKALTVARAKIESKSNGDELLEESGPSIAFKKRLL